MDGDIDTEAWQCLERLTRLRGLWVDLTAGDGQRAFPTSVAELVWLWQLHVSGCANTRSLPANIEQLEGLEELELSGCGLEEAELLVQLPKLRKIGLPDCRSLTALPASLGDLTALQQLDLSGCRSLAALPDSFGQLAGLQRLDLSGCR
jgi:Leucine-rich repeat (LRR) protein